MVINKSTFSTSCEFLEVAIEGENLSALLLGPNVKVNVDQIELGLGIKIKSLD